jgi:cell division transport system permease protein
VIDVFVHRLIYFFRVTANSLTRNVLPNLVSTATMALALFIFGAVVLIGVNIQHVVASATEELSVTVYLEDGIDQGRMERIAQAARGFDGVRRVTYVSKERAMERLKRLLAEEADVLEGLETNPLPASLELLLEPKLRHGGGLLMLTDRLSGLDGVADVDYAWQWAEQLASLARMVKIGGFVIGGFLFTAVVFIVANTIKLTVLARWDELYIMRLMGATEGFIQTPFLLEGLAQGLVGGVLSVILLYLVHTVVTTQIELPFGLSLIEFTFLPGPMVWFMVLAGAAMGFLGSLLSMGKMARI